jgi:tRNA(Ile)-lysidine synthase
MPGEVIAPVGADEFAFLLDSFAPPLAAPFALAVSGGCDSMALAFCAKRWSESSASRKIIAFIVDHGLRAESAAEAAQVKTSLAQMGVASEILRWEHEPVTTGLHEKARAGRYRLLTGACRRFGASDLMIAHHRDDQAETILMRLAKGSGVEGLAGMERQAMRGDIRLLRPFLSLPKERLAATCRSASIPFVEDPSNSMEKFARGRLRKILPALADDGLTVKSLVGLGARAAEAKEALDHYTKKFLRDATQTGIGGSVRIDRALLREIPRAIGLRALTACLRYVHEDEHPPEHAALSSLFDVLIHGSDETTRTLYGCIVSIAPDRIALLREPSAASEVLPICAGETVLWDKRWLVTAEKGQPELTIRALGVPPHALIDRLTPGLRRKIPQGRIRASLG